jgi:hypothetical protein
MNRSVNQPINKALSAFSRYAHEAVHAIASIEKPRAITR